MTAKKVVAKMSQPPANTPKNKPTPNITQKKHNIDSRFSAAFKDPRFKQTKSKETRTKIDDRFSAMLTDDDFKETNVDTFNRVKTKQTNKDFSKLYETYTKDDIDNNIDDIYPQDIESDHIESSQLDAIVDESSTDIGSTDDEEDEEDEVIPDGYTQGSIKGSIAQLVENPTPRLALYNMEWEQLRAVDVLAITRSLCPPGGHISSCSIYPSKFGLEMMEREKRGDFTLWSDPSLDVIAKKIANKKQTSQKKQRHLSKKGMKYHQNKIHLNESDHDTASDNDEEYLSDSEIDHILYGADEEDAKTIQANQKKLHEYELGKLRYYYAILVCDSVETAYKLYTEVDGLEYEASSNIFDLRFVPNDHVFDESTLRDRASTVPPNHRPPNFVTNCLTSTNIACTWEREDPRRARFLQQDFTTEEYNVDDLTAFLANTSDEEGFATDVPISETDSGESSTSDDHSSDDATASDTSDNDPLTKRNSKRFDTLGKDRIVGTKMLDGKKKNIISLKRRARNEFASILDEIHCEKPGTIDAVKRDKQKKKILAKANKRLQMSDNDDDNTSTDGEPEDLSKNTKQKKKPSIVLQSALNTFAQTIVDTKKKNDEEERLSRLSVWQRQLEQQKLKKQQKKDTKKIAEKEAKIDPITRTPLTTTDGSLYSDDDVDMNDPFFKNMDIKDVFDEKEFGSVALNSSSQTAINKTLTTTGSVAPKIRASKPAPTTTISDDNDSEIEGYNVSALVKKNKIKQLAIDLKKSSSKDQEEQLINLALGFDTYSQREKTTLTEKDVKRAAYMVNKIDANSKKKQKVNTSDLLAQHHVQLSGDSTDTTPITTSFKMNLNDDRFHAVFDDADFGIDVNNPQFLETEGTTQLLAETQRRRKIKQQERELTTKKRKLGIVNVKTVENSSNSGKLSNDLQSLVGQVKIASKMNKVIKKK